MELTNKIGQRALTYVASLANQGYELTFDEFEAYVSMPMPTVKSPWGGGDDLEEVFKSEKEPVLDWLVRLGWLARAERTVRITQLGRAVLGAVERHEVAVELPTEINLGPEDRFSYSRLLGRLGNLRDAMLVDRYLNHDQLMEILDGSTITRVLIGNDRQLEAERRGLAAALSRSIGLDRPFYVGVSAELRDRFLIPPSGDVSFFGQVISGGGHKGMVVGTVSAPAADAIRRSFEDVWSRATPLAADSLASQADLVTSGASARPSSSGGTAGSGSPSTSTSNSTSNSTGGSPSARVSDEPRLQTANWQSGRSLDTPPTSSNSGHNRDGDDNPRWSVDDARS